MTADTRVQPDATPASGTPTPDLPIPDMEQIGAFADRIAMTMTGAATGAMIAVGDRLGLYAALARSGPVTPADLAALTGTHQRYVAEWLAQQAAAGIVEYNPAASVFTLPPAHAAVLASDDSPAAMAGVAPLLIGMYRGVDRMVSAFRDGTGIDWGEQDPAIFESTERFFRVGYRNGLISEWIPKLDGISARLARGGRVADIGCGYGAALLLLAAAYPDAELVGFDAHGPSIDVARERAEEAGVADRVRFEVADAYTFPPGPYDLVCYFATLHDLGDPARSAAHARSSLAPDGLVMLVEPAAANDLATNLAGNPGAALNYAASTFLCAPNALADHGVMALGAQAGEARLRQVLGEAGLGTVRRVAEDRMNMVLEARP